MDADATFSAEVERALRRVRSTGDIEEPPRPTRHSSITQRRSEGQRHVDWSRRPTSRAQLRAGGLLSEGAAIPELPRPPEPTYHAPRPPYRNDTWETNLSIPEDTHAEEARRHNSRVPPRGWLGRVMVFFGQAGPNARVRTQLISLVWTLSSGLVQFVVIVAFLAYAAHHESPTVPGLSEWDACQRPLGAWNAIWVVREALTCLCAYWQWRRERTVRQIQDRSSSPDAETASPTWNHATGSLNPPRRNNTFSTTRRRPTTQDLLAQLPYNHLYNRLSMLSSALTLVWFLTAHILEYTSVNTCRHAAPHLWWLTFGILCTLYFMILEIFLLGLLVFILGPVLFLFWNIILLCLGRHPLQNPHHIRPDVGKLPKDVVDQIPLVLYIPPPPEGTEDTKGSKGSSPITVPSSVYSYPPNKGATTAVRKRRFAFLRRSKKSKETDAEKGSSAGDEKSKKRTVPAEPITWEDHWVPGDYPFVRLEGNRAACAICLMDYEEPEKVRKETVAEDKAPNSPNSGAVEEVQVEEISREDADRLQLQDAGEGAQPLRLLLCGHVFHKTCIDPWLIDVSGRCPVCQRPVELPEPKKEKKEQRNNRRTP